MSHEVMNLEAQLVVQIDCTNNDEFIDRLIRTMEAFTDRLKTNKEELNGGQMTAFGDSVNARLSIQRTQSYINAMERNILKEIESLTKAIAVEQQHGRPTNMLQKAIVERREMIENMRGQEFGITGL